MYLIMVLLMNVLKPQLKFKQWKIFIEKYWISHFKFYFLFLDSLIKLALPQLAAFDL